jgi:hypothetical protein
LGIEDVRIGILGDVTLVHPVVRPASQLGDFFVRERSLDVTYALAGAPQGHQLRLVVPLLQMGKPVVSHELDPECGKNVQDGRFLVIAVRLGRIIGKDVSFIAQFGMLLVAAQKLAADHLGIGFKETQTIAMTVLCEQVLAKVRKRRFELHVSGE